MKLVLAFIATVFGATTSFSSEVIYDLSEDYELVTDSFEDIQFVNIDVIGVREKDTLDLYPLFVELDYEDGFQIGKDIRALCAAIGFPTDMGYGWRYPSLTAEATVGFDWGEGRGLTKTTAGSLPYFVIQEGKVNITGFNCQRP